MTYPFRQTFIHQAETNAVLWGIQQPIEGCQFTQYLQHPEQMQQGNTGVTGFQAADGIDGGAHTLGQFLLGEVSPSPGQGNSLPEPFETPLDR